MERTLVVFKPDAVQRQLVGTILNRFERKGLKIAALRLVRVSRELAQTMYAEHEGQPFYEPLLAFITAGPVVVMIVEGYDAVGMVRSLMGPTFGPDAPAGTIRGDFGASRRCNLIHGSDSPAGAEREIPLFFREEDILNYELVGEPWLYADIDKQLRPSEQS